jgi:hypothetical protein
VEGFFLGRRGVAMERGQWSDREAVERNRSWQNAYPAAREDGMLSTAMAETAPLAKRREFFNKCDPRQPLEAGSALYENLDGLTVRGDGGQSCIDILEETVLLSDRPTLQLFSGFPGTGKTTELLRLRKRLMEQTDPSICVLYVDFEKHLVNPSVPIELAQVYWSLAFVLDVAARIDTFEPLDADDIDVAPSAKPDAFGDDSYIGYLAGLLSTSGREKQPWQRDPKALMRSLRSNSPSGDGAREALLRIVSNDFEAFTRRSRSFIQGAVATIKERRNVERVLVIVDGLEKLRPSTEEHRAMIEDSATEVFSELPKDTELACDVIFTFPLFVRYRTPNLGRYGNCQPQILPMVKVYERRTPEQPNDTVYEPGIAALVQMLKKRLDTDLVFGADGGERLRRVVLASGGYFRELLRYARELVRSPTYPVTEQQVDRVLAGIREDFQLAIRRNELSLLRYVAASNRAPADEAKNLPGFARMIALEMVLAYRNGDRDQPEWFRLHPLVEQTEIYRTYTAQ